MVVGEVATPVDLLVLGGGPGGYAAALHASRLGRSVTLVERKAVGGVCLNVGCIPSKTLIEISDAHALGARVKSWGLETTAKADMVQIKSHLNEVVAGLTKGVTKLLADSGTAVIQGHARFTRPGRVSVEHDGTVEFIDYKEVITATGSRPIELSDVPFDGGQVVDSTGLLFTDNLPERLVLVGGGYIGIELGCAFAKLGSEVTIVEAEDRVLPNFDTRISRQVTQGLRRLGIGLCLSHQAVGTDEHGLVVTGPEGQLTLPADQISIAVGRRPNSDTVSLGQTAADIRSDGLVEVNPSREACKHVYAIGDLTTGPALAHKATAEAQVAADAACGRPAAFDPTCIPMVIFSDPQVMVVGMDRDEATNAGLQPEVFRFPLAASGRAHTCGEAEGSVTLIADGEGTVIGVQAVGRHVAELAGEAALAVETAATVEDLAGTIHAHPTLGESLMEAALGLLGRPVHTG